MHILLKNPENTLPTGTGLRSASSTLLKKVAINL